MRYGSVCSGIEAATMAWHPLGWTPEFFSEIEKFPCAVLAHHYQNVPNLGDMTKFEGWPDHAIDILVGGTPCQSFSVAGLRHGLADPRGNLMLTYLAIARRYQPRWLVWENVPGVLSSNKGRDFGTFIRGMEECGYHAAWRVLDAQYVRTHGFGRAVPQRRRRVFVVGYLGDWRRAAAVLFEPEGMRGDTPPRREAGKGTSADVAQCLVSSGRVVERTGDTRCQENVVAEVASTLNAAFGSKLGLEDQHINSGAPLFVAHSLRGEGFDASEDGTGRGTPIVPVFAHDTAATLTRGAESSGKGGYAGRRQEDDVNLVASNWAVRRLTPRECERLQGFPDDFTLIPHGRRVSEEKLGGDFIKYQMRGNPKHLTREDIGRLAADGPRYKALGNSMAVNVMRWIGKRIQYVESIEGRA